MGSKKHLIETRVLKNTPSGWVSFPYVWNENQTDAKLSLAGARITASWIHYDGKPLEILYSVPNINQCKNCHTLNNIQQPIGPKIRNLNFDLVYGDGIQNQLKKWISIGMLETIPDFDILPRTVDYSNEKDGTINERARAWLDINCAHCHREGGSAGNSGFYLSHEETNNTSLGIMKKPVAAGRGSGGLKYVIKPGTPEESILLYRMASTDPGVMMPELSRNMEHKEAIPLIKEWIDSIN